MKKKFDLFSIFIFLSICSLCSYLTYKVITNDTFYTIKIGEFISKHGIDFKDHYSFIEGLPYSYPHWLYDVIIYQIYNLFGFTGLYIMNIVLYSLLILIVYNIIKKFNNGNRLLAFIYSIICCFYFKNFVFTRAHLVTIILFLLFLYCLNKFVVGKNKKYCIICFLISALIANLHCAVWPFLFVLLLPFFAEYFVLKIINKRKERRKKDSSESMLDDKFILDNELDFKYLLITFGLCFISGIFTPLRLEPYTYLIKTMLGNSQSYIAEHQPLVLIDNNFCLIFLVFSISILFLKCKIKFREFFMIVGIFFLSLISVRHHIFLLTIGGIYLMIILYRTISLYDTYTLNYIEKILCKKWILLPVLIIFLSFTVYNNCNNKDKMISKNLYPVDSVKWIKENLDYKNIKMYNSYDIGSYILFNDIKVFIDSRADLYTPEFNKKNLAIFDDYSNMKLTELNEKYDFTHILTYTESEEYNYLILNSDYKKIYEDKSFSIFEVIKK